MTTYKGQCQCGAVQFVCDGEPLFTQYCHCNKCREIAALCQRQQDHRGYAFTAAYLTDKFHIQAGKDYLEGIVRNKARLFVCHACRCLIYGISLDPALQAGIGINANNFGFGEQLPASFQPQRHIWYADHIVDIKDDLPKFKNAPVEQGGTGECY